MKSTVLCADIGTTSLKAGIITGKGEVVSFSQQEFQNPDGMYAAGAWFPALCTAVRQMTGKEDIIETISAICISGNGPTIVSGDGTTLLWNRDIPAGDYAGSPAARSLFIPRIAAFRTIYPSAWNAARFVYSGPEYLIYKLTGTSVTILPEERYKEAYWTDTQLMSVSLPEAKLPGYVPTSYNAGLTTPMTTAQLGLPDPVPVFCGGPDFIAAMVGTNSLAAGKIYDCAGSSEGVNICTPFPITGHGIRSLPSVMPGMWNAGVLQAESGRMFVNFRKIVEAIEERDVSYAELISMCIANPDSDGFDILELIAGNFGKAVHMLLDAAQKNGITPVMPVAVTGGQAKNDQWMQMKCNYAGVPLSVCTCADAELIGDAVMAFTGLGIYGSLQQAAAAIVRAAKTYVPEHKQ